MKKEIKDILGLLIIALPAFILLFVWWLHSPMYEEVQREQRFNAQSFLVQTYYYDIEAYDPQVKKKMIDYYGFNDEDINPGKILDRFIESQDTANYSEVSRLRPAPTIDSYLRNLFREAQDEGTD